MQGLICSLQGLTCSTQGLTCCTKALPIERLTLCSVQGRTCGPSCCCTTPHLFHVEPYMVHVRLSPPLSITESPQDVPARVHTKWRGLAGPIPPFLISGPSRTTSNSQPVLEETYIAQIRPCLRQKRPCMAQIRPCIEEIGPGVGRKGPCIEQIRPWRE